jgi:multidrug efflux pump subunit AcrA (membrane-fusion protein)
VTGCKPPERKKDSAVEVRPERVFLAPVLARRLERRDVVSTVPTTGSIVPVRSRLLRTEEAGRLHFTRPWQEGDDVEAGTVIARIVSDNLIGDIQRGQADVRLQEEALDIARKSMDSAIREFETTQGLYSRGITALREVDRAELDMQRAVNSYRQAEINLDKARSSLRVLLERETRLEIVAPFDGLIVARNTIEGSRPFANAFGTETITDFDGRLVSAEFAVCGVIDISSVFVRCDVTSRDIDKIRINQEAFGTIYARGEAAVAGRVVDVSRATSQDTRAFLVDVLLPNPDRALRPGMFGRMEIVTERRQQAIAIDKSLLVRRNNRDVVFIVERPPESPHAIAREVAVELGLEGRDQIEVTWGLKQGDAIITRGFEVLQDQSPVAPIMEDDPLRPGSSTTVRPEEDAANGP